MGALIDLTGEKYGRLVVIKRAPNRYRRVHWLCRCDCGNEVTVASMNLRAGSTRSCGCLHAETARKNGQTVMLPEGEAAFRALFKQYRLNAKNRGINFELSRGQFRTLTRQNCHYCGSEPLAVLTGATYNGAYTYNGVDRIDNTLGYVLDNCVPCCKFCNLAKAGATYDEFIAYLDRVAAFRRRR